MPVDQIANGAGLYQSGTSSPYFGGGIVTEQYKYDPAQSVPLTNGMLVELEPIASPNVGPVLIKQSAATADNYVLGVVTDAPTGGYLPGQVVQVIVQGYALGLFAAAPTAGQFATQGTTAGTLAGSATATAGAVVGVILGSGFAAGLVPIRIIRM